MSIQIPRVLPKRGRNSLDVERDSFVRNQVTSLTKALNSAETPVKEKHVRILVIGTHHEKSASLFWHYATKQSLQGHPIVCWKFFAVLHKLIRDGHRCVIPDSTRYCGFIADLGKLWGHLKDGYGKLISHYGNLIRQKLEFHKKYNDIQGNLNMEVEELEQMCNSDINSFFELSVDLLDHMDDILLLQQTVFASLDMSRSNSLTPSGQCRLSPLILCIQDSCHLYDFIVKFLFKLHASLPPDTLSGHRQRFYEQYKLLKQFYDNSSNLQYFKNLIKVPRLPENAPNFLVQSDFSDYETPVAVVPSIEASSACPTDLLVDTSSINSEDTSLMEESMVVDELDERDELISQLMHEINDLKAAIQRLKAEDQMMMESLQQRVRELEFELKEYLQIAESIQVENESLKLALKEVEANSSASAENLSLSQQMQAGEEKFKKLKDIYTKLREEHVNLIRTHADLKKEKMKLQSDREEQQRQIEVDTAELMELRSMRVEMDASQKRASDLSLEVEQLKTAGQTTGTKLEETEKHQATLENRLSEANREQEEVTSRLASADREQKEIESRLRDIESAKLSLEQSLRKEEEKGKCLTTELSNCQKDAEEAVTLHQMQLASQLYDLLIVSVEKGKEIIEGSLQQFQNELVSSLTCPAEYLAMRSEPTIENLGSLKLMFDNYRANKAVIGPLVRQVCSFSHHLAVLILHGKVAANTAEIEAGQALVETSRKAGEESLVVLEMLKKDNCIDAEVTQLTATLRQLLSQATALIPVVLDVQAEQMGDLIDQEMQETTNAIEQAAQRIAEMLSQTRQKHSGVQLEVNEGIFDSCNNLMETIKVLIIRSKVLQREIVAQGRGSSSTKEFYKKHHRWTEGLISAAKAVGWGANVLVEGADKVSQGGGNFEQLVVCAQEIAASTTQLVVSSKVKADRTSEGLKLLSEASKNVTQATGKVVASAKTGAQLVEEGDVMDFSHLTLHQAKRQEMDSQVRVLQLENDLIKERRKLSELRKKHYQMAGESEDVEQESLENVGHKSVEG